MLEKKWPAGAQQFWVVLKGTQSPIEAELGEALQRLSAGNVDCVWINADSSANKFNVVDLGENTSVRNYTLSTTH